MSFHRFATLTEQGESGLTSADFEALFAPDVIFYAPYLLKPLSDKQLTIRFLREVFALGRYPKYTHQFSDDTNTTLFLWEGQITGPDNRDFTLEGSLAITEGADGLIHKVVSYLRPLQVAVLLKEPMVKSESTVLPKEYWEAVKPASAA